MIVDNALDVGDVALRGVAEDSILECCHSIAVLHHAPDVLEAQKRVECTRDVGIARAYSVNDVDGFVGGLGIVLALCAIIDEGGEVVPLR